jgi:hypothetical protein
MKRIILLAIEFAFLISLIYSQNVTQFDFFRSNKLNLFIAEGFLIST